MDSQSDEEKGISRRPHSRPSSSSSDDLNANMNPASTQLLSKDGSYHNQPFSPASAGGSDLPYSPPYSTPGDAYRDSPPVTGNSEPEQPYGASDVKQRPIPPHLTDPALHDMRRASVAFAQAPKKGFRHNYEPVDWLNLVILLIAVAISWTIGQFAPKPWIQGYSLTVARVVVGVIGMVIGLLCGFALFVRIGTKIYASVMFATLVHSEMTLNTIDQCATPAAYDALRLLEYRLRSHDTKKSQRPYDQRPWSLWIVYFLFVFMLSNVGAFVYGRTVIIYTVAQPQFDNFHEVPVLGELSAADLQYALDLAPTFQALTTSWTLASVSSIVVPSTASLPFVDEANGSKKTVYFTEASSSLFSPTAVGPAASLWRAYITQSFSANITTDVGVTDDALGSPIAQGADATRTGTRIPVAVEYPAWGSQVQCATFGSAGGTVAVTSGVFQIAAPQNAVQSLLGQVGADLGLASSYALNITGGMVQMGAFPDDGIGSSTFSQTLDDGSGGGGYVILDTVLVRLNTSEAPNGQFFYTTSLGGATIGVDGAVCITRISPYVVRAVDSAGTVGLTAILGEGSSISEFPRGSNTNPPLSTKPTQNLTSTAKSTAMANALFNSRNHLLKDNGRVSAYVANPTLVQMTDISRTASVPSIAFGQLNSSLVAKVLAGADTRFLLPYLVGQGRVPGRAYTFDQLAYAYVKTEWLALLMGIILLTGLVGVFFVPSPPFNLPFRDLTVSSWLSFAEQVPRTAGLEDNFEDLRPVKLRYGR